VITTGTKPAPRLRRPGRAAPGPAAAGDTWIIDGAAYLIRRPFFLLP